MWGEEKTREYLTGQASVHRKHELPTTSEQLVRCQEVKSRFGKSQTS